MVDFQYVFAEWYMDKYRWMNEKINERPKRSFIDLIQYPHFVDEKGEV